jgi:hypothetical protein
MSTGGVGLLAVLMFTEAVPALAACRSTVGLKDYMDGGGSLVHANKEPVPRKLPFNFFCDRIACSGTIDFSFLIDEKGRVSNVSIVKNTWTVDPEYHASFAMSHVTKMRYVPPRLKGKPVCVLGKLRYDLGGEAGK